MPLRDSLTAIYQFYLIVVALTRTTLYALSLSIMAVVRGTNTTARLEGAPYPTTAIRKETMSTNFPQASDEELAHASPSTRVSGSSSDHALPRNETIPASDVEESSLSQGLYYCD